MKYPGNILISTIRCSSMQLTVSELRKIIQNFMKEQFEVEKFRINSAIPNETNKIWTLLISYNIEISHSVELGDLKLEPRLSLVKSCFVIVDDEKKQVYAWYEA